MINLSNNWQDYQCLATGNGEKLEKWGNYILRRPDPQIIWDKEDNPIWNEWDGFYHRSTKGGGSWEFRKQLPEYWKINYRNLTFKVSPTNFKHTGIFPEQATNWDYIIEKLTNFNRQNIRVLNLFAYTGCATMAAASCNVEEVVHLDASKGIIDWAKENMHLCKLDNKKIRFIVDDAIKFLEKEKRRGRTYHAIIMDPPSYGRGPNKEIWRLEDNINELLEKTKEVLDKDYCFVLINAYTTGISSISLNNILKKTFPNSKIITGEIGLPTNENLTLPCGIYGKITKD